MNCDYVLPSFKCPVCEARILSSRNPVSCPQCNTVIWHKDDEVLCWKVLREGTELSA